MIVISKVDDENFIKDKIYEHFLTVTISYKIRRGRLGGGFFGVILNEYSNSKDALNKIPPEYNKHLHHTKYKIYVCEYSIKYGSKTIKMNYKDFNKKFRRIDKHRNKVIENLIK